MLTRSRILRRFWMTIHCWICTEESLCLEPFYSRIKINLDIFYTNYSIRLGPQSWCSEMNITSTVKRLWNIIKCWSNLFFNGLLARVICKMLQGGGSLDQYSEVRGWVKKCGWVMAWVGTCKQTSWEIWREEEICSCIPAQTLHWEFSCPPWGPAWRWGVPIFRYQGLIWEMDIWSFSWWKIVRHWIEGIRICIRSCICIEGTFGQRGI